MNHLNLLPWSFRRRLLVRKRLRQWASVAVLASSLVLSAAGLRFAQLGRQQTLLNRLEMRCASLTEKQKEVARIEAQLAEFRIAQSICSRVENQQLPLKALGLVSQAVQAGQGSVQVRRLSLERSVQTTPAADKTKKPETHETVSLQLDGVAADNLSIAQLTLRLRESGTFDTVDLKAAAPSTPGGLEFPYAVDCVYRSRAPDSTVKN